MKEKKAKKELKILERACAAATTYESDFARHYEIERIIYHKQYDDEFVEKLKAEINDAGDSRLSAQFTVKRLINKQIPRKLDVTVKPYDDLTGEYLITARCPDCERIMFQFTYDGLHPKKYFFNGNPKNGFDIVRYVKDLYGKGIIEFQYCSICGKKIKWKKR